MDKETTNLISGLLGKKRLAQEQLLMRYGQMVFRLVKRIVTQQEDTEEVYQDVFVKAFEALIQPALKPLKKLKGVKTYPVYWRHDKGFDDDVVHGNLSQKTTRQSTYGDNSHTGLTTGTYYFIPSQYKDEVDALYKQLDSLTYDYINSHPEQPYQYDFSKRIPVQNPGDLLWGIPYEGSDDYNLKFTQDQEGYHILCLTTKGELWMPREWRKLKSYINGKLEYRK